MTTLLGHSIFTRIFSESPDACMVLDRNATVLALNAAYLQFLSLASDALLGKNYFEVIEQGSEVFKGESPRLRESFGRVMEKGIVDTYCINSALGESVFGLTSDLLEIRNAPLRDERGNVDYIFHRLHLREKPAAWEEIAARHQFLSEASRSFNSTLDVDTALRNICRLAVPRLADYCIVHRVGKQGNLQLFEVAASSKQAEQLLWGEAEKRALNTKAQHGPEFVYRTAQTELIENVTPDIINAVAECAEQVELLNNIGARSTICIALRARGKVLGTMLWAACHDRRPYRADDVAFAEEVAARASLAIDNATLYREAQDALYRQTESLLLLNTFLDASPVGFAVFDLNYEFVRANQSFADIFQLKRDDILGRSILDLLPDMGTEIIKSFHHVTNTGKARSNLEMQGEIFGLPGPRRHFLASFHPVKESDGRTAGIGVVFFEMTARKKAENDLKRAKENAESANRAKTAFLANMSHEIRTPLSAMLGFTDLLIERDQSPSERAGFAAVIKRNAEQLSRLIDDLLDLSKVEAGRLQIENISFDLPDLVEDVLAMFRHKACEKKIILEARIDGEIPETIVSDPTRLRQILSNVVGNAVKFTERGSVTLMVRSQRAAPSALTTELFFDVHDTGCGVSNADSLHLFQPFQQGDVSTTRRFGGTGLGLALSRRLARALDGELNLIRSDLGQGSSFRVQVRAGLFLGTRFLQSLTESKKTVPAFSNQSKTLLKGCRVLIAEDTPDNQFIVSRFLKSSGADVEVANDGEQAIAKALDSFFDVILMDVQMPRMDGCQAVQTLRAKGFVQPILALTAHAMSEEREKCRISGFTGHLSKPVDRQALVEAVYAHWSGSTPGGLVESMLESSAGETGADINVQS